MWHIARLGIFKQREIKPVKFLDTLSRDALEIAIHAGGSIYNAANLLFTLCPESCHRFSLFVQVVVHFAEFLDNCLDSMAEARASEVLVHQLHLRLVSFACL